MKVLHVIGPLRTGGAQTQLLELVKAAHGTHWDATVVATSGGAMAEDFRATGVPFIELKRWGSPGLLRMRALRRIVSRGDFDVVNSHLWQANAYARVAVAGRKQRPAVVIVEHNHEPGRHRAKRVLDAKLDRWTDGYVAVTDAMADFVAAVHRVEARPIAKIPYALDKETFSPGAPRPGSGGLQVGAMGRLDQEKGFAVLIDAVRRLVGEGHRVELRIVGTGPLRDELRQLATGLPVQLVGGLEPGPACAEFLRSLDVFVLPSVAREARPVVLLEAIACGLPVITTALPGLAETVGGAGVLVAPGDAGALAEAITEVAADLPGQRERSVRERQAIPDLDQVARSYSELFQRVMSGRRG